MLFAVRECRRHCVIIFVYKQDTHILLRYVLYFYDKLCDVMSHRLGYMN